MDSLTQIVLGAACGELVLGRKAGNKALFWGGVAGTIPDLDVVLNPFFSPVDQLFVHRGYSHSVFFAFLVAPMLGFLIRKIHPTSAARLRDWIVLSFCGIFTHPLLDAFTGYGTPLFLPFSDYRFDINSIFIIDPLYTLPFLFCIIMVLRAGRNHEARFSWAKRGVLISTAYLLFTVLTQQLNVHALRKSLEEKGIVPVKDMAFATPLNSFLSGYVADVDSGYYVSYRSVFDKSKPDFSFIPARKELLEKFGTVPDLEKLISFTKGFYLVDPQTDGLYLCDLRFGQMGGWVDPQAPFVFSFLLSSSDNGTLIVEKGNWRRARFEYFNTIWGRIFHEKK